MPQPRILVAEDDGGLVELIAFTLRDEGGYEVDVAATVAAARELLAARRYELVIADWWLPDGDGLRLANEAAELGAKTFVMSGYSLTLLGAAALRHRLLRKPIRPSELLEAVHYEIGEGSPGPAGEATRVG